MGRGAQIGFHAAYTVESGQQTETSAGNALVGAYLNRIGLPDRAVIYITQAAPQSMTWLSLADAAQQGIDVAPFSLADKASTAQPSPPAPAPAAPQPIVPVTPTQLPPQLSDEEADIASRLARNFNEVYQNKGMSGINTGVDACYQRLLVARTEKIGKYCVALDWLATSLDAGMSRKLKIEQNEFNKTANMHQRAFRAAVLIGLQNRADEWISQGVLVATRAEQIISEMLARH
jgi:hypothetical protein